jgi:hypothetical protein
MTRLLIWNGVAVLLFLAIWGAVHLYNQLPCCWTGWMGG